MSTMVALPYPWTQANALAAVPIASDDLLLRDPAVLEQQAAHLHQQIYIGEIEAAGFVQACPGRHPTVPWFVIRGVSDFGDQFKNDAFHTRAALAAAAYLEAFLRDGFDARVFTTDPPFHL